MLSTVVHRHSADLTVVGFFGPGRHLRVDVKSGVESGASNAGASAAGRWALDRERSCRRQHRGSPVLPWVVSAEGSLGPAAAGVIAKLGRACGALLPRSDGLSWTVPSHGLYWHRRFRSLGLVGWHSVVAEVTATQVLRAGDPPSEAAVAEALEYLSSGASARCCACSQPRQLCCCHCGECGCVVAAAPTSTAAGAGVGLPLWPPCERCNACQGCCSCPV